MSPLLSSRDPLIHSFLEFSQLWSSFVSRRLRRAFLGFEGLKGALAELLYRQRGKMARPFVHSGMVALSAMGIMLAPVISEEFPGRDALWEQVAPSAVLSAATENPEIATTESDRQRDQIMEYPVVEGDTLSTIAEKFGISQETIIWQNDLPPKAVLKPGQKLEILPVSGVSHKVGKGETIYSLAKKYQVDSQPIVDFPFNTFVNDETFALAVGQILIIPGGTPPKEVPTTSGFAGRTTPNAGTVTASGSFVWPTQGYVSQGFAWYHKAVDIANSSGPDVLAADSGTIVTAGWPDGAGYGNRVIIDHGNGYTSLYAHLSKIYVSAGQTVRRGDSVGKMGSTGRSTGTHLHFEVHQGGASKNPLDFLR